MIFVFGEQTPFILVGKIEPLRGEPEVRTNLFEKPANVFVILAFCQNGDRFRFLYERYGRFEPTNPFSLKSGHLVLDGLLFRKQFRLSRLIFFGRHDAGNEAVHQAGQPAVKDYNFIVQLLSESIRRLGVLAPLLFQFGDHTRRPIGGQRNFLNGGGYLLAQHFLPNILLRASRFPFRATVIGVAFLDFCGNQTAALAAMDEATENEILGDFFVRLALTRHHRLNIVKKFLRYDRFVPALVYLAAEAHKTAKERIFKELLEVRYRQGRVRSPQQTKFVYGLSEQGEGISAGGIQLERLPDEGRLRRINDDILIVLVVQIPERSHLRPQSIFEFLPYPSPDVLRKVVHIILGLAERDLEHKLPLRRVLKPKSREFQLAEFADVEKPDNFAAVHRVAGEAVWVPRENTIGNAALYVRKHFVEYRAAGGFGGLLLGIHFDDFDVLTRSKLAEFRQLVVNAPHLPLLRVGGLAGIEEKLFGLSVVHSFGKKRKDWCERSEPQFTVSNFRLAAKRLDFTYQNEWCLLTENENQFELRPVLDKIRTYFRDKI